jgi:hypothetical protein
MKKSVWITATSVMAAVAMLVSLASMSGWVLGKPNLQAGGSPGVVSYQGQVLTSGQPYDGSGYFKFAIVDAAGTTSYWSNDGTSSDGGEPTASVGLTVDGGLFSLLLGDTNLAGMSLALDGMVFSDPDTYLRVWFSEDDATFTQLGDQKIASVPYALQAEMALDADSLGGVDASGYQLQVIGSCPVGYAVREINTDGSVVCEIVEAQPGFSITTYSDAISSFGESSSLAIGVDGLGLVSYMEKPGYNLSVGHCHDVACTAMTVSTFEETNTVGIYSSITIGSDGFGLIASMDGTDKALLVTHCNNIACTSADTYVVEDSTKTGYYISIETGSDGYGLIAYADFSSSPWAVKVAHCTNTACSSSDVYIVDNTTGVVGYTLSLAIGADGLGLISYSDYGAYDLHVAHCNDISCSSSSHTTIDTSGNVGMNSSITIGVDGLGLISYLGAGPGLVVAHCQNLACTAADINTIESITDLSGTAITIGMDGLGLIAYYQHVADGVLRLAHCVDTICSSATINTFDEYALGSYPTFGLTIGSDGLPLISYVYTGGATSVLKIAHCSNRFCVPYNRSH